MTDGIETFDFEDGDGDDVLHTTGREYLIEDIDKYIVARKKRYNVC